MTIKMGVHYLLAQVLATSFVLVWNFVSNSKWTFRTRGPVGEQSSTAKLVAPTSTDEFVIRYIEAKLPSLPREAPRLCRGGSQSLT